MDKYRPIRRTNLFLVRVWREDKETSGEGSGESGAIGASTNNGRKEWCGSVQRVVSGEAHQFSSWQGLTDLLAEMVSQDEGR